MNLFSRYVVTALLFIALMLCECYSLPLVFCLIQSGHWALGFVIGVALGVVTIEGAALVTGRLSIE